MTAKTNVAHVVGLVVAACIGSTGCNSDPPSVYETAYRETIAGHGSRYFDVKLSVPRDHRRLACCESDIHWVQWTGASMVRLDTTPPADPECTPLLRLPTFAGEQRLCGSGVGLRIQRTVTNGTDELWCSVTHFRDLDVGDAWRTCAEMHVELGRLTMQPGPPRTVSLSDGDARFDVDLGLPDGYRHIPMPQLDAARVMSFQRSEAPTIQIELNGTLYMKASDGDRFDRVMTGPSWYERPCQHIVEREELPDGYLVVCNEPPGRRAIRFINADADKISCSISGAQLDRDAISICTSMRARRRS